MWPAQGKLCHASCVRHMLGLWQQVAAGELLLLFFFFLELFVRRRVMELRLIGGLQKHLVAALAGQALWHSACFLAASASRPACTDTTLATYDFCSPQHCWGPAGPMRKTLCGSAALPVLEAVRVLGAAPAPGLRAALEVLGPRALHGASGADRVLQVLRQVAPAPLQARLPAHKAAVHHPGQCPPDQPVYCGRMACTCPAMS